MWGMPDKAKEGARTFLTECPGSRALGACYWVRFSPR